VLIDQADDGQLFPAYMLKNRLSDTLPVREVGEYDQGSNLGYGALLEFVQDYTAGKAVAFGYTDLTTRARAMISANIPAAWIGSLTNSTTTPST